MSLQNKIDKENIPQHIAVIMDGNGRWAKKQGQDRVFGHKNGVKAVRDCTEACAELGVKVLTLYAFSTENWDRPKAEIDALMELLVQTIQMEEKKLMENNIQLQTIGNIKSLPESCQSNLNSMIEHTSTNTGLILNLALSYSSKWEMIEMVKQIAQKVKNNDLAIENINEDMLVNHLSTSGMPDPELLIRTSGEYRISNFLLWQIAYAELYFTDILWPEFNKEELYKAVLNYQSRERRFGKTSEQLNIK